MHVPQEFAERNVMFEIKNVAKGYDLRRVVIEHQQHTRERQHDEEIERDTAHPPGVLVAHRVAIDLRGMQMQKDVRENCERTITRVGAFVRHAEDRLPNLGLLRVLVILGFFESAILQRHRSVFGALNQAGV